MTQMLTIHEVIRAARQAFAEGRLQAQVSDAGSSYPVYVDNSTGAVCAIGAALDEATRNRVRESYRLNHSPLPQLIALNLIEFPDEDQSQAANIIQMAHDNWVDPREHPGNDIGTLRGKPYPIPYCLNGDRFLEILNDVEEAFS